MNPKVGGSSPPQFDIFCLKIFDTFKRTPVRVSKMNAVARAQLTFQVLTLLQKHICIWRYGCILPHFRGKTQLIIDSHNVRPPPHLHPTKRGCDLNDIRIHVFGDNACFACRPKLEHIPSKGIYFIDKTPTKWYTFAWDDRKVLVTILWLLLFINPYADYAVIYNR